MAQWDVFMSLETHWPSWLNMSLFFLLSWLMRCPIWLKAYSQSWLGMYIPCHNITHNIIPHFAYVDENFTIARNTIVKTMKSKAAYSCFSWMSLSLTYFDSLVYGHLAYCSTEVALAARCPIVFFYGNLCSIVKLITIYSSALY